MPTFPQRSTRALRALGFCLSLMFLMSLALPAPAAAQTQGGSQVQLVPVTTGLSSPVGVTHAGDGSGRLFIIEREGRIRIWNGSQLLSSPFLNIATLIQCAPSCGERGLLGLAFHPSFETNGSFYVFYTRAGDGTLVVSHYTAPAGSNVANTTGTILLTIAHPAGNHNGGHLAFGPDGYLYIATGDGGGGGDPNDNGQNLNTLLGKILRIDVNGDDFPTDPNRNYAIPSDNPFAGATAGADEIWDYGLRNPWRFSFDRSTGDLWIGDVGQGNWEEIDFEPAPSGGGVNYGWDVLEGRHCHEDVPTGSCSAFLAGGSTLPVLEYSHSFGCSVTGGYVYRGGVPSFLTGQYLYGDFCSGRIWRGSPSGGGTWTATEMFDTSLGISSFGESENGRIYITDLNGSSLQWLAVYTFSDVRPTHAFWPFVEAISTAGITAGCTTGTPPAYCPDQNVSRAEMAIFLLRGRYGASYTPPPATGTVFADVPSTSFGAAWIEQLFNEGLVAGCDTNPRRYCPTTNVRRDEMAVFLLRAKYGSTFTPAPATGTVFADVPASYWAAPWIERLFSEGITAGCATGPLRYCPDGAVPRGPMAAFLSRTFALPLP